MRIKAMSAALAAMLVVPPGAAASNEDAVFITGVLLDAGLQEQARRPIALAIVDNYAHMLRQNAVEVLDRERFARLLPFEVTDEWIALLHREVADRCYRQFSAEVLRDVAEALRADPDLTSDPAVDFASAPVQVNMALGLCHDTTVARLSDALRKRGVGVRPEHEPVLAEILQVEGIAAFPNSTVRQAVIKAMVGPRD